MLKVPKAVIDQIEANKSEVSDKCYGKCYCVVSNGNRTERSQIRSVINDTSDSHLLIKSMITDNRMTRRPITN